MVTDYLFDTKYLAGLLVDADVGHSDMIRHNKCDTYGMYLYYLCSAIKQNGRLLRGTNQSWFQCLPKKSPQKQVSLSLDSLKSVLTNSKYTLKDELLDEHSDLTKRLLLEMSGKGKSPCVVITDKNLDIDNVSCFRLDQYFHKTGRKSPEHIRLSKLHKTTFNHDSKLEFERNIRKLAMGQQAFTLIDRYILAKRSRMSIAYWVGLLAQEANITIEIITQRYSYRDKGGQIVYEEFSVEELANTMRSHISKISLPKGNKVITIKVTIKMESKDDKQQILFRDAFHDRFICTDQRYFAIGKGLDVYLNNKLCLFNIYYCGHEDRNAPDRIALSQIPNALLGFQEKTIECVSVNGVPVTFHIQPCQNE